MEQIRQCSVWCTSSNTPTAQVNTPTAHGNARCGAPRAIRFAQGNMPAAHGNARCDAPRAIRFA